MMVSGLVLQMTGESAQRAALGAGAIVMDVIALNDGRRPHEKIRRLRQLRPDMILLSGGTDWWRRASRHRDAELIAAADRARASAPATNCPSSTPGTGTPPPRFGVPGGPHRLTVVPNLRPTLEREHLKPARDAIHELFMEHVMGACPEATRSS